MATARRALITGAGSSNGIGFECARGLLARGYEVAITGLSDRVMERAAELNHSFAGASSEVATSNSNKKILALAGDLTDPDFVEELVKLIEREWGALDLLVNSAGMTSIAKSAESAGETGGIDHLTPQSWQSAIDRNLTSTFLLTQKTLPLLRTSRSGRIINITSVTGAVMAMHNEIAYASAKAALVGFTRALALDEAKNGITVNAIAPGWIATESQREDEAKQGLNVPLGRSGTAAEIASAIYWLASESASYITGQTIVIDGGNSIAEERKI
jgi:3-oxoacyl-[acyl-carrier protein] reductase